jgi:hypothetical protein
MQLLMIERAREFGERHQVIDWLRAQRESGDSFAVDPDAVHALLQEIDLLQVVAQAAEHVAAFPCGESAGEPLKHLRNSLLRWKE